jgi:hypothetical protein
LIVGTDGDSTSPLTVVRLVRQRFVLALREDLSRDFSDRVNLGVTMELGSILNEVEQVLAILVLGLDGGDDGLGVVEDTVGAGEGAAFMQWDGDTSIDLDWSSGGEGNECESSEQGCLAEHGVDAGGGSERGYGDSEQGAGSREQGAGVT